LPLATLDFCRTKLFEVGIDLDSLTAASKSVDQHDRQAGEKMHIQAYHTLRGFVRAHLTSSSPLQLLETAKPIGGYEEIQSYGGLLQDVIEENAKYASIGQAIEEQLAKERDHPELYEEDNLPDDYEIVFED
jgi:predicted  nucleic acid-binding Zn ribbon protein